jgi:hypothetical protein
MPMPNYRNTNLPLIYGLLAIVIICGFSIAGPFTLQPAMNDLAKNITLQEFETAFQDVQHPAGTERLSLRTKMENYVNNDEGCDIYVGEVRRYNSSEEVILAPYHDQEVNDNPIQVVFFESGRIPAVVSDSLPEPLNDLVGWGLPPGVKQQPLYMVYLMIVDFEGDLSIDCH